PRAELPGGNQQPRVPSWSDENAQPSLEAPRGHDEDGSSRSPQDPGSPASHDSTAQFPRVQDGPRTGPGQDTGTFVRSDVFGGVQNGGGAAYPGSGPSGSGPSGSGPSGSGSSGSGFPSAPQRPQPTSDVPSPSSSPSSSPSPSSSYDSGRHETGQYGNGQFETGQFETGQYETGQYENDRYDAGRTGQFERPAAPRQRGDQGIPAQPTAERDYLTQDPGPGDGRTPLYDTLETNWFHGQRDGRQSQTPAAPATGGSGLSGLPRRGGAPQQEPQRP
ncbi:hypothetical protein OFY01_17465, partial [Streptomyces sp. GXMU-J5]|nr:hypothetical protein [Streptomyces beihaiensis]